MVWPNPVYPGTPILASQFNGLLSTFSTWADSVNALLSVSPGSGAFTGPVTFQAAVTFSGATTFTGAITAAGATFSGAATFNAGLTASAASLGATTFTGTITAAGASFSAAAAFNGGLTANAATLGATTFSGAITAAAASFSGAVAFNGGLSANAATLGATTFTGAIGAATFNGAATFTAGITANAATLGATTFSDMVTVSLPSSLSSVATGIGGLQVKVTNGQAAVDIWDNTTTGTPVPAGGARWRIFADNQGGAGGTLTFGFYDVANLRLTAGFDNSGVFFASQGLNVPAASTFTGAITAGAAAFSGAATFSAVTTNGNLSSSVPALQVKVSNAAAVLDLWNNTPAGATPSGGSRWRLTAANYSDGATFGLTFLDMAANRQCAGFDSAGWFNATLGVKTAGLNVTDATAITLGSGWASWGASFTAFGSMTVSGVTLTDAQFLRFGPIVFCKLYATFTLGGTASNVVFVSLPSSVAGGLSFVPLAVKQAGGTWSSGWGFADPSGTLLKIQINGEGNFALGSTQVLVSFFYRT